MAEYLQFAFLFLFVIAATLVLGVTLQVVSNLCLWALALVESSRERFARKPWQAPPPARGTLAAPR